MIINIQTVILIVVGALGVDLLPQFDFNGFSNIQPFANSMDFNRPWTFSKPMNPFLHDVNNHRHKPTDYYGFNFHRPYKHQHDDDESVPNKIVTPREFRMNRNPNKKRISQIKYEAYLTNIFPNLEMEAVQEVTNFNGRELARPGEFPHMGAIGFRNMVLNRTEYKCGASLLSHMFAVTSAHCTDFNGTPPKYIRFGDLNLAAGEENVDPQTREIGTIYNHPDYKDDSFYHDIAILKFKKPVLFTEFVRPIRLWHRKYIPFPHAFAMGFGSVQLAGAVTNRLTLFNLTILSNDVCRDILPAQLNAEQGIIRSQVCAMDYRNMGSDTFQGDSGGPLQVTFHGHRRGALHTYLIGITSFGVLGAIRYPGVYTRVSSYANWIEGIVWDDDFSEV